MTPKTDAATPNILSAATVEEAVRDLHAWVSVHWLQILIAAGAGLVVYSILFMLRGLARRVKHVPGERPGVANLFGRAVGRTSQLFLILASARLVASYANPPAPVFQTISGLFTVAAVFQAALWLREVILGVIERRTDDDGHGESLANAMSIIRLLVSVALFAIATVVVLDNVGVNVTGLVAGLGIGGIAIGLAAQGIFADLFAALSILFDKPFRKGDTIRFDQATGTVERIGLKTTRLRSIGGEQIIMSNTKLLEREIHNLADGRQRRIAIPFGLRYETSPDKLAQVEAIANEAVEAVKGCKPQRCTLVNFGTSSLDYQLVMDVKSVDADRLARDRAAVMLALIERFAKEGIDFAYPVQIAYTAAPDGSLVAPA